MEEAGIKIIVDTFYIGCSIRHIKENYMADLRWELHRQKALRYI